MHGHTGKDVMTQLCQNILSQHFNVLGIFNLVGYKRNMPELYTQLKRIKKSYFNPSDRIVFTLFDHDYHLNNQGPPWSLYNLQLILKDLDIPNYFCLLLTNQPNYNEYTTQLQYTLTTDDFPIRSFTTLLNDDWLPGDVSPTTPMIDKIEKSYCLLSRQARPHRTFLMAKIMANNLQNYGIIGYNNIPFVENSTTNSNTDLNINDLNFSFLEIPSKHQVVLLRNQLNRELYEQFSKTYSSYKNFNEDISIMDKNFSTSMSKNITPISKGLLYIGAETEVNLEKVHSSRISLRGIVELRPFVLLSSPGALSFLKSRGFSTFSSFWNEDYDSTTNLELRVDKIIQIIQYVSKLNKNELVDLYRQMFPTIQNNYIWYHQGFEENEKKLLSTYCHTNLSNTDLFD